MSVIFGRTASVVVPSAMLILSACGVEGHTETEALVVKDVEQAAGPVTIEKLEALVGPDAILLMDREGYPDTYAKLGNQQFQKANDLTRWAAIAAVARGSACDRLELIGVSGQSSRERVAWYADCENGARIFIEQPEAEEAKLRFGSAG